MEFFGIKGFGHKPERTVHTLAVEAVLSQLERMPEVQEAITAFTRQRDDMVSTKRVLNDAALLEEKRNAITAALRKRGIALEPVPGRYDHAADESIELLLEQQAAAAVKEYGSPNHSQS